jgi:hypothetical protein
MLTTRQKKNGPRSTVLRRILETQFLPTQLLIQEMVVEETIGLLLGMLVFCTLISLVAAVLL